MDCFIRMYHHELQHTIRPDWLQCGFRQYDVRFQLYHDMRNWLQRHSFFGYLPSQWLLDDSLWLYYCKLYQLSHSDQLCYFFRALYLRRYSRGNLCYRLHWHRLVHYLSSQHDMDDIQWLYNS